MALIKREILTSRKVLSTTLARVIDSCFAKTCFPEYGFFSLKNVSFSVEKLTHLLCNDFPSFSRRRNG